MTEAAVVAATMQEIRLTIGYDPASVVEFGCGDGARLQCLRAFGSSLVVGIDKTGEQWRVETLDRKPCLGVGAQHVFADPTQAFELDRRFELTLALDVADRIDTPSSRAGVLIDSLCETSDRILFCSDAEKLEYWSRLFRSRGYLGQDLLRHRLPSETSRKLRAGTLLFCRADRMIFPPSFEILIPSGDGTAERELTIAVNQLARDLGAVQHNVDNQACVDKARCELAEMFMRGGSAEYAVFIDADQTPTAQQIYDLLIMARMSKRELLAAFSSRKTLPSNHAHGATADGSLPIIGLMGPQQRFRQIGFGMVAMHRNAFRRIAAWSRRHSMHPWAIRATSLGAGKRARDFFRPVLAMPNPGKKCLRTGDWVREYLGEDASFCARLMAAGGSVWATPAIWPGHAGRFTFGREHVA